MIDQANKQNKSLLKTTKYGMECGPTILLTRMQWMHQAGQKGVKNYKKNMTEASERKKINERNRNTSREIDKE